jgi:D-sedoheptulose 7-phosphate isomerase
MAAKRLFVIGNGGSALTASHFVADARKIMRIQAFCPTDNAAELTARINDESWEDCYMNWLEVFVPTEEDVLLVLSVGGGDVDGVSENLIMAIDYAKACGMATTAIVGAPGGYCAKTCDVCMLIDASAKRKTLLVEGITSVILHAIVCLYQENQEVK